MKKIGDHPQMSKTYNNTQFREKIPSMGWDLYF